MTELRTEHKLGLCLAPNARWAYERVPLGNPHTTTVLWYSPLMSAPKARTLDLARRIMARVEREGLKKGAKLTETRLSELLGVSRSPVRAALSLLATRGVVHSKPNVGHFLSLDADGDAFRDRAIPESGEEHIYRDLVRARFANLAPAQISVAGVMRRYDVDRATANRVLGRMAEEGVVVRGPGRSYRFGPVLNDANAYHDSYEFRLLIEPAAITAPGFQPDPVAFARLRARHEEMLAGAVETAPVSEMFAVDADFHETVAECCGNRFLRQAIRQQTHLRRLSEYENYGDRARLAESCREHLEILDAIEAGDLDIAAARLADHIATSRRVRPDFAKVRALAHRRLTRV